MRRFHLYSLYGLWLLTLLILPVLGPLPWETPTTQIWYMRNDTHTINGQLGYVLNTTAVTGANGSASKSLVTVTDSPQTVVSSTTEGMIRYPNQQHILYAQSRYWVFYYNGTTPRTIYYRTSSDGITWSSSTQVTTGDSGEHFAIAFNSSENAIHYVVSSGYGSTLKYRKGILQTGGSISWSATEQTITAPWNYDWWYFRDSDTGLTGTVYDAVNGTYGSSNYTTEVVVGTAAAGALFYIDPYQNTTSSFGTSEPVAILNKGWRTPQFNRTYQHGGWTPSLRLRVRVTSTFKGRIGVRIWNSTNADLSGATVLQGWTWLSEKTYTTQDEHITTNEEMYVTDATLTDSYLYFELIFNVTQAAGSAEAGFFLEGNDQQCRMRANEYVDWISGSFYDVALSSAGYPHIIVVNSNGFNNTVTVINSTTSNGVFTRDTWTELIETDSFQENYNTRLLALTGDRFMCLFQTGEEPIYTRYYNGSWQTQINVTNTYEDYPRYKEQWKAVTNNTVVHLVYNNMSAPPRQLRYSQWTLGSGWAAATAVGDDANEDKVPSTTLTTAGDLYVLWLNTTHLLYKIRYANATWGSVVVFQGDSNIRPLMGVQSSHCDYNSQIPIAYVNGTSPYTVRFTRIGAVTGYQTTQVGYGIWRRLSSNVSVALVGSVSGIISRSAMGAGLQTTTYSMSTRALASQEALLVRIYYRIAAEAWETAALCITPRLQYTGFANSTWTFYLWTERAGTNNATHYTTTVTFKWGAVNSRITNVQLTPFSPWEQQEYDLREGEFVRFVFYPWTYWLGNVFWGFILLFMDVTLYNKYEDVRPVLAMTWIFAGSGGVITALIPGVVLHISWLFVALALAGTLFYMLR